MANSIMKMKLAFFVLLASVACSSYCMIEGHGIERVNSWRRDWEANIQSAAQKDEQAAEFFLHKSTTALHEAASFGDLESLQLLAALEPIDMHNGNSRTALYIAIKNGHLAIVEQLLAQGALREACDHDGRTPLHYAAERLDFVIDPNNALGNRGYHKNVALALIDLLSDYDENRGTPALCASEEMRNTPPSHCPEPAAPH